MSPFKLSRKFLYTTLVALSVGFTGCLTDSDDDDKEPEPTVLTSKSVKLGAQTNATLGSALDLDGPNVWKISDAVANSAEVDLIFAFSTAANASAIYSPDAAKNGIGGSAGFTFLANMTTANKTEIKRVEDKSKFESTDTQAKLETLWESTTVIDPARLLIAKGDVAMAKSNKGQIVLFKIDDVTTSATGTTDLALKAKF